MPLDPSIALGVQAPKMMNPAEMLSLQNVARQGQLQQVQLEEAQRGQQDKNALRTLLQDPENIDAKTGTISQIGLSKISQLNPQMGMQLQAQQQKAIADRAALTLHNLQITEKQNNALEEAMTGVYGGYQQMAGKVPKEQAGQLFKDSWNARLNDLEKTGQFSPQQIETFRKISGPDDAVSLLAGTKVYKDFSTTHVKTDTKRERISGDQIIQEEKQPDGTWKQIGSGPRFARQVAPVVNVNSAPTAGKSYIDPAHVDLHGDDYLKKLPTGVASSVKAIAEGRASLSTLSIRGGEREAMLQRVTQYDPSFDASNAGARAAVRKDFTSGPSARNVTAINTAIGHLGSLDELGDALKNKDTRILNTIFNKIATETGTSNVNNFNIARDAVGHELMRVFRQVGASKEESDAFQAKFKDANSPEQLKGAVKTAAELLKSRIDALDDQWKRGMNTDKGYENLLSPKSKGVMERVSKYGSKPDVGGAYSDAEKEKRYQAWKAKQK